MRMLIRCLLTCIVRPTRGRSLRQSRSPPEHLRSGSPNLPCVGAPWAFNDPFAGAVRPAGTMTLVEGSAFCISAPNGDIIPGEVHGLFDRDTRFLSSFLLLVDDRPVEYLSLHCAAPVSGEDVARARPGSAHAEPSLVVVRTRYVGQGMREDVVLRNFGAEPARVNLTVIVDTDFAHIFEVKERRLQPRAPYEGSASGSRLAS